MCEPAHSIIQFPTEIPSSMVDYKPRIERAVQGSFELQLQYAQPKEKRAILEIPQGIVIGPFINYSRLGSGHSECLAQLKSKIREYIPEEMKYEALWWERRVKIDTIFDPEWLKEFVIEESISAATEYARRSSIGDLKILRRFLEVSLQTSDRPSTYSYQFVLNLLSKRGRAKLNEALQKLFYGKKLHDLDTIEKCLREDRFKNQIIGIMMKITRERRNLNDAWADDVGLWKGGNKMIHAR